MRPPKRPTASAEGDIASIRTRASFSGKIEWEALELGALTVVLVRFKKPVDEQFKEWGVSLPAGLRVNGCQAYSTGPVGSVRELFLHAFDFIPAEHRPKDAALRVHLAGGSDQWVGPSKLAKFLASGRDGPLTGLDWGRMPD